MLVQLKIHYEEMPMTEILNAPCAAIQSTAAEGKEHSQGMSALKFAEVIAKTFLGEPRNIQPEETEECEEDETEEIEEYDEDDKEYEEDDEEYEEDEDEEENDEDFDLKEEKTTCEDLQADWIEYLKRREEDRRRKAEQRRQLAEEKQRRLEEIKIYLDLACRKEKQSQYLRPDADCLFRTPGQSEANSHKETGEIICRMLRRKGLGAEYLEAVESGYTTGYQYQLKLGARMETVRNCLGGIKIRLGVQEISAQPVPGRPSVINIMIPNEKPATYFLGDVAEKCLSEPGRLMIPVGRNALGEDVAADLNDLRHLFIEGTTGSGKSVFLHTIITSILMQCSPDEVSFVMSDTTGLELFAYNNIPHLILPVFSMLDKTVQVLEYAARIVENRIRWIGVRGLEHYNEQWAKDPEYPTLPHIVFVIDGLSMEDKWEEEKAEHYIYKILLRGAAVGVHLIIAAQYYPSRILSERVREYIPSIVSMTTEARGKAPGLLKSTEKNYLKGRGDMLYLPRGAREPLRLRGYCITEQDIQQVTDLLDGSDRCGDRGNLLEAWMYEYRRPQAYPDDRDEETELDDLYETAVELALKDRGISVSALQRHLHLGYAKCARIVDKMEEQGIVGPLQGGRPRMLLITWEEWWKIKYKDDTSDL